MKSKGLFFLILFAGALFAQNKPVSLSSVEEALALSAAKNPDLNVYILKQSKSQQEIKNANWAYIPSVSGSFGLQYNIDRQTSALPGEIFGMPGQTKNVQLGTDYVYNTGVGISLDVFNMQTILQNRIAKINAEMQDAQTQAYGQLLREQTALYYFSALIFQHSVEIYQKNLQTSDSILILSKERYENGLTDLFTYNQAKIVVNSLQQTLSLNEKNARDYLFLLKNLLGMEADTELILNEVIAVKENPLPEIQGLKADKNLDVTRLMKKQTEADIQLKKSFFMPKLSLNGYWGFQNLSNEAFEFDWSKYNYVGINLALPVTNGFKNLGNLKMAKWNDRINAQVLQNETDKSELKNAQLISNYRYGLQQLPLSYSNYQLSQQNAALAFQKYTEGLISSDSYLRTYEEYLKFQQNYLNTLSSVYLYYSTIISRQYYAD